MAAAPDMFAASDELAALGESEARLRAIFDNTDDLIVATDLEHRVTSVNPALVRLIGLPLDEIVGRPFEDFVAPEWRPQPAAATRAKVSGRSERTVYDLELLAGDGRSVPVEVSSWLIYEDGRPVGIQGIGRDVSERQAAEARYRQLVESLPLVTYMGAPADWGALETIFVSPQIEALLGFPAAAWAGVGFWRTCVHADDRERVIPAVTEAAHRGETFDDEYRMVAADGRVVWVHDVQVPELDADGRLVRMQGFLLDVTDRRQAEEALRENEALFRAAFDNAASGMLLLALDGRIEQANAAFCELLGYEPHEARGLNVIELTHPDDRAELRAALPRLACGEISSIGVEKRYVRMDGEPVWVEVAVGPVRDSTGTVIGFVTQVLDISARREAESAVRDSEELFRAAFEDAATGMLVVDPDGSILHGNAAMCQMLGYTAEEIRTLDVFAITHPGDRDASRDLVAALRSGEVRSQTVEKRYLRKDGEIVWVRRSASSVVDAKGNLRFVVGIAVDITATRASDERFRMLFESNPQGMNIVDRDGRIVQANPAMARMLGYDETELFGLTLADITHPDDLALDRALFDEVMQGGRTHFELEHRVLRKDGGSVTVHLTAFALTDEAGTPQYSIGVLEDVTERRSLEEQLRQAQRMEAIGQLAGGVAHDFNNLLTAITSYCDLAAAAEGPFRASVDGIRGAADRAAELTQQLLAFSRRQVLEMTVLDVNAAVSQQIPMLDRLLGEDVQTVLSLTPGVASVTMDAGRLTQVVMNLAVNARDAMPDGGVLTIETRNVELQNAPTTSGDHLSGPHVLLAVSDTGCGMDEATIAHAFEPFFTTKEPGKGTGLGLPTVLGIVEQSGGRLSVYSEPGVGTTFKVYMPCADRPAGVTEAPIPASPNAWPQGHERVLLVEDNESVRRPLAQLLEEFGYDVVVAAGPADALALPDDLEFDLLLTDVVMPEMNGRQLAELLRPGHPDMHVLFISGYTDDAVIARGLVEPGMAFLQKPFGADKLAEKLRELLDA